MFDWHHPHVVVERVELLPLIRVFHGYIVHLRNVGDFSVRIQAWRSRRPGSLKQHRCEALKSRDFTFTVVFLEIFWWVYGSPFCLCVLVLTCQLETGWLVLEFDMPLPEVTPVLVTSQSAVVTAQVVSASRWHHIMQSWYTVVFSACALNVKKQTFLLAVSFMWVTVDTLALGAYIFFVLDFNQTCRCCASIVS